MKILSAAEMREVDRLTTERYGVPSLTLMENAATRTVEAAESRFGSLTGTRALVICGRGNNGGDGAAVARIIHSIGASVDLLLLGTVAEARGDARINLDRARALGSDPRFRFAEIADSAALDEAVREHEYDICLDAIFGTGLTRPATGLFEAAIDFINRLGDAVPVVAVDIPSGLPSDSSEPIGPAVRAKLTVTFTAPKIANIFPPASDQNGELVVSPIGSPDELVDSCGSRLTLIDRAIIAGWLRASRRGDHANKGDVGKVLIVAGSRGKTGAACLAGEAAMRAGCGLVTVATAASSQLVLASRLMVECMTEALSETSGGSISHEAAERALELADERDVLAIGPGLGSSDESTRAFVRAVASLCRNPIVIDADGLNCLAPWPASLRGTGERPIVITPHPGEMARLIESTVSDVVKRRIEVAREFAVAHNLSLVLKGSPTVVGAPDGEVFVNRTGNSGMASGGTGDVLTGIVASLIAQKPDDPIRAVASAVYLHGLAGDLAASRAGVRAMVASDIISHLGGAFIQTGGERERLTRGLE
jgi:ADP-dependent NAD(P)H-hydrate dehydratase / NAD(P)H-hydrate epimerase